MSRVVDEQCAKASSTSLGTGLFTEYPLFESGIVGDKVFDV